jgi:hypothetical protein
VRLLLLVYSLCTRGAPYTVFLIKLQLLIKKKKHIEIEPIYPVPFPCLNLLVDRKEMINYKLLVH